MRNASHSCLSYGMVLCWLLSAGAQGAEMKAFPTAEGFGATTPGGRGGRVIYVTNLNESGPGSLRAALEATGPRIVLFKVSGTIELSGNIHISQRTGWR